MSNRLIGRWESLWPSEPYLAIRVAISVQDRDIAILHQLVEQSWVPFEASDDAYVRNAIAEQIDAIIDNPESYGMRGVDEIPAAWLYDQAHPGEVDIGCPVPSPEGAFDRAFGNSKRRERRR